jgi:hypothetical protein
MSLRDQLLKAGIVDKKKVQETNRALKSERKEAAGHRESREIKETREAAEAAARAAQAAAEAERRRAERKLREAEREIVARWTREFPGLTVQTEDCEKGLAVIRVRRPVSPEPGEFSSPAPVDDGRATS